MVHLAKILGLTISDNLVWNNHVNNVIKKANKRLSFLVQLKKAKVPIKDIINFYCICIRPTLEYGAQVFHYALPGYLQETLERVQKRVLSIIYPGISYHDSLVLSGLPNLTVRRQELCEKLFCSVNSDSNHKLHNLIPFTKGQRAYELPFIQTNRFENTFIPSSCKYEMSADRKSVV